MAEYEKREGPWPVGTKLRYWPHGLSKPYRRVEVMGYTAAGRVLVKLVTSGEVRILKSKSLSVL